MIVVVKHSYNSWHSPKHGKSDAFDFKSIIMLLSSLLCSCMDLLIMCLVTLFISTWNLWKASYISNQFPVCTCFVHADMLFCLSMLLFTWMHIVLLLPIVTVYYDLNLQGERLSHAVGCAFAICLERKQKRDKESTTNVTVTYSENRSTFERMGSFRQTSLTERLTDPQSAILAGMLNVFTQYL